MRHGETVWNAEGRLQGAFDSPLTGRGRRQAAAMGRILAALRVSPRTHDALSSPQGRAEQTARLALGRTGLVARPEPRLREIGMGEWAGLTRTEIATRWPAPPDEGILTFYARCPGGEDLSAVAERAADLLLSLRRPAVLVTHGLTLRLLAALALGRDWDAAEALCLPQGRVLRLRDGRADMPEPPRTSSDRTRLELGIKGL